MKTKEAVIKKPYFCKDDIRVLLNYSHKNAKQVFEWAEEIDDAELGAYRIEKKKVRPTSVERVTGISLELLMKQIKSGLPSKDTA